MPYTHTSIFDSSNIITKKDLCALLNLDTSRSDLRFTPTEINQAYRKRALRFHSDKQQQFTIKIPNEICNVLMADIKLAKDYLLKGEDNIPGNQFKNPKPPAQSGDWTDFFISALNSAKNGTSTVKSTVDWLYYLSSSTLLVLTLSTYSDGQLNLRYINLFSKHIAAIRPYVKDIDGTYAVQLLNLIRDSINKAESIDAKQLIDLMKLIVPSLIKTQFPEGKLDRLIQAIQESSQALKDLLTDDFIARVQHVIAFWPSVIANIPTWSQILGVYFTSLFFTATSLPKFFNALKVLTEVILEQKGIVQFLFFGIPLLLLSAVILPINIIVQLILPTVWIALKASCQIFMNGLQLLNSVLTMLFIWSPEIKTTFAQEAFNFFDAGFNLIIRLPINMVLELVNAVLFVLSNTNPLSSIQEQFNTAIDQWMNSMRPSSLSQEIQPVAEPNKPTPQKQSPTATNQTFFSNGKQPNHQDVWLESLLDKIAAEESSTNTKAA